MRKLGKKLAMVGLVATMSIAGAISSMAMTIEYSDENAVDNLGTLVPISYGEMTFTGVPLGYVGQEDLQFRFARGNVVSEVVIYGYIENGEFVYTYSDDDMPALGSEEMYRYQPVFDMVQVQKDKSSGKIKDRMYGIVIFSFETDKNGEEHQVWNMWAFVLGNSNTSGITENENNNSVRGWKQDSVGWWYQYSDGSYIKSSWFQDADGTWYYFNSDGYMLANTTTPDGYYVNASGAWVQTQESTQVAPQTPDMSGETSGGSESRYSSRLSEDVTWGGGGGNADDSNITVH